MPKKKTKKPLYLYEPRRGGWIYFMRIKTPGGPVKIGRTSKLNLRFTNLQIGVPWDIEPLVLAVDHENYETTLHRHFEHLSMRGEWFKMEGKLLELIADLRGQADSAIAVADHLVPVFKGDLNYWLEPKVDITEPLVAPDYPDVQGRTSNTAHGLACDECLPRRNTRVHTKTDCRTMKMAQPA